MPTESFSVDGILIDRIRHSRSLDHYGTQDTTVVVLQEPLAGFPAGTDVQTVLEDLFSRLLVLEGANRVVGVFSADAFLAWHVRANSVLFKTITGSGVPADATFVSYSTSSNSFSASALINIISSGYSFTAKAYFIDYVG